MVCVFEFPADVRAEDTPEVYEIDEIFVVGSRRPVRSISDTPSPIDVIDSEELSDQATGDLSTLLRTLLPSYNVGTQPISDAATFVRPINLRGLAPDQVLVFVNGKRRHRAAVIQFNGGNGVSEGSQGPDVSVIPAIALDRVEVLRDSASAQYGSDAIAGVVNFVLKDRPDGGVIETQWGETYEGDGDEYRIAGNLGVPLADRGFVNLSAEWREADPTVRSVQRDDAAALIAAGNPHVRQPYAQIWGQPEVSDDWKAFLNLGFDATEQTTLYAFGNHSSRVSEGGFFFRNPNTRKGVYVCGGKRSEADPKPNDRRLSGGTNCPDNSEEVADPNEFFQGYPDRFTFNERFPGGFTPKFKGEMTDTAGAIGVRGEGNSGLTYDVSFTIGRNKIDFSIRDTVNASLGAQTPTQFDLGSYAQTEKTGNLDLTYPFDVPVLASPLYAAAGVEWRNEQFEIGAGERASWEAGPLSNAGFSVGANGFSGFSPDVAGKWDQSNVGAYVEFGADVLPPVTLTAMGRWEKFEEFDSTIDGKAAMLFQAHRGFGVRGSVGTGFRVPTVGQQNVLNVSTIYSDGELRKQGTIPSTCPEARLLGGEQLTPEKSLTFTAGFVIEAEPVTLTADYFNIKVKDRLGQSKDRRLTTHQRTNLGGSPCLTDDVGELRYFGNDFDTRTQGVDVVASIDVPTTASFLAGGETELVFAGNWTKTRVISHNSDFLDKERIIELEDSLPNYRFNATLRHAQERWSGYARLNYFGSYTELHGGDPSRLFRPGSELTLDVEMSYRPIDQIEFSIGAENILNNFPDENPFAGDLGSKYPEFSPMGFAGGFYYARARYFF